MSSTSNTEWWMGLVEASNVGGYGRHSGGTGGVIDMERASAPLSCCERWCALRCACSSLGDKVVSNWRRASMQTAHAWYACATRGASMTLHFIDGCGVDTSGLSAA